MKLGNFSLKFEIGDEIWLKVNNEMKGVITGISIRPGPSISYLVTWNNCEEMQHYDFELSLEKPEEY